MKTYGLIGYPLTHSFSKKYFTEKFQREGITDCRYELFEIKEASELPELIKNNPDLVGLSVTIPHKESVIRYMNELDEPVKKIRAVNVIKINDGKLIGYNSDFHGFKASLQKFLPEGFKGDALVLGSGGSAKAVKAALESMKIHFTTVSRNRTGHAFAYEDLNKKYIDSHTLIINTTPLGMYPNVNDCPPIPFEFISSAHFLFDLVYNPEETLFMKKGAAQGARTKNGLEMLGLQAEKAWEIWNSK
jgi:shikimate dehydrogenase